jgi:hypothetical protein
MKATKNYQKTENRGTIRKSLLAILLIVMFTMLAFSQTEKRVSTFSRNSIGSSLFLLGNIKDSVNFFQLNYGYRLTLKDIIIAEAITWTYYEPLGTYGSSDEFYPGKVKAYGIGLGYQRFLWKNLFTTVEPTFFLQQYYNAGNEHIQNGFQLYLQFILGYRFEFFQKRLFVEPAYAIKYWPVNTNVPSSFETIESGAPKYKFEPSLNFGIRF